MLERKERNIFSLVIGIVGVLGAFLALLGYIIPVAIYPNIEENPGIFLIKSYVTVLDDYFPFTIAQMVIPLIFIITILIVSLLFVINSIKQFLEKRFIQNLLGLVFGAFIFLPIFSLIDYTTCVSIMATSMTALSSQFAYYALRDINESFRIIPTSGFIFLSAGLFFLVINFFLILLLIFWRHSSERIQREDNQIKNNNTLNKIINITLSGFAILLGISISIGMAFPYATYVFRNIIPPNISRIPSFILPHSSILRDYITYYQPYPNFSAILYMLFGFICGIFGVIYLLTSLKIIKKPNTVGPLVINIIVLLLLPIFNVYEFYIDFYPYPTFAQLLFFYTDLFETLNTSQAFYEIGYTNQKTVLSFSGGLLFVGLIVLILTVIVLLVKFSLISISKSGRILAPIYEEREVEQEEIEKRPIKREERIEKSQQKQPLYFFSKGAIREESSVNENPEISTGIELSDEDFDKHK